MRDSIDLAGLDFTLKALVGKGVAVTVAIFQANSIWQAEQVAKMWRDVHEMTVILYQKTKWARDNVDAHVETYIYESEES